jgi:hypothetical protein
MKLDLSITPCAGHATGAVYQFAEGVWPDPIVGGVFVGEAAFDFVEPLIKRAWPQWEGMDRYGVTRIGHPSCLALINELRSAADKVDRRSSPPEWLGNSGAYKPDQVRQEFDANPGRYEEAAALFRGVAEWLESAMARTDDLSLLGI